MRVSPSRGQMKYLDSIGATTGRIPAPTMRSAPSVSPAPVVKATNHPKNVAPVPAFPNRPWLAALVVSGVIALMTFVGILIRACTMAVLIALLLTSTSSAGDDIVSAPPQAAEAPVQVPVDKGKAMVDEALTTEQRSGEVSTDDCPPVSAETANRVSEKSASSRRGIAPHEEATPHFVAKPPVSDAEIDALTLRVNWLEAVIRQQQSYRPPLRVDDDQQRWWWGSMPEVSSVVLAATVIGIGIVVAAIWLRRCRQDLQAVARDGSSTDITSQSTNRVTANGHQSSCHQNNATGRGAKPNRMQLHDRKSRSRFVMVRTTAPSEPWSLSALSVTGNVRSKNEDCSIAAEVGDWKFIVIADGCGGVPHGATASRLAAEAAASELVWNLAAEDADVDRVVKLAFKASARQLEAEGKKLGIWHVSDGLRTTLLIVVAAKDRIFFAHIGDGGCEILRADGTRQVLLIPQRNDPAATNVLAASLGPQIQGEPRFIEARRQPGDLLVCGTDGVFDRIGVEFPKDVLRLAVQKNGDLNAVVESVLHDLAAAEDSNGTFICDDNMTLALLGDGHPPRLSPGFWKSTEPTPETKKENLTC